MIIHRTESLIVNPEEVFNDPNLLHHMPGPPVPEQLPIPPHFAADIHFHRANWFLGENVRVKISINNSACSTAV